jgi:hypothetical protein
MPLVIPDLQLPPTFDGQSVSDSTDWAAATASEAGTGVVSGLNVVALGTAVMAASVNPGAFIVNGLEYTYAGGSVAVTAASVSDRRDIVTINTSSIPAVTAGTPCGTAGWTRNSAALPPVKPAIPSSQCLLGEIYVANTTASVASGNIIDKTTLCTAGNYNATALAASASYAANAASVIMSTGTLGVGTWCIDAQCGLVATTLTTAGFVVTMVAGTASASFSGPTSCEAAVPAANDRTQLSLTTIAQVTTAGSLSMKIEGNENATIEAADTYSFGKPTGIVCVRIA